MVTTDIDVDKLFEILGWFSITDLVLTLVGILPYADIPEVILEFISEVVQAVLILSYVL